MKLVEAINSHKPGAARLLKCCPHDRGCFIPDEINAINCDKSQKSEIHTAYRLFGMSLTFNKSLPGSVDLRIGLPNVLGLPRLECSVKSSVLVVLKASRELDLLDFQHRTQRFCLSSSELIHGPESSNDSICDSPRSVSKPVANPSLLQLLDDSFTAKLRDKTQSTAVEAHAR